MKHKFKTHIKVADRLCFALDALAAIHTGILFVSKIHIEEDYAF